MRHIENARLSGRASTFVCFARNNKLDYIDLVAALLKSNPLIPSPDDKCKANKNTRVRKIFYLKNYYIFEDDST